MARKKSNSKRYTPMSKVDIEESRRKLGVFEIDHMIICSFQDCNKEGVKKCYYCGGMYCNYHSGPKLVTSLNDPKRSDRSDYERWKAYNDSWDSEDGHPCPNYSVWWNSDHERKRQANLEGVKTSRHRRTTNEKEPPKPELDEKPKKKPGLWQSIKDFLGFA